MTKHSVTRRGFLRAAGLSALGLGLAACAAPPAAAPSAGVAEAPSTTTETVSLNFVCDTINAGHQKVRDEWAKAFGEQNPGIVINHQPVPGSDYNTKIQTLFAAGTPPDVYRYLQEVTPIVTVADKKLHLELDPFISSDNYDTTDFRPSAMALYQWNGSTYALPRDYGHQNLFLNLDLLDKEGIAPPPADWTDTGFKFDTFLDIAQKLTKKEGDRTVQWGFLVNRGWRPWASWVYNNGATVVKMNEQGVASEMSLNDPKAVAALQFLQDLMYKHGVAPRPDIESEMGGFELFASGKVGMMINNPSAVNQYRTITGFKWDVATLPLGEATTRGTGGGGTGWASGAGTKYPSQSWQFLKYISSADAELDEVRVGATTPARVSVVQSKEFLDTEKGPANIAAFAQAQEFVVRDPVHVRWPEIFQRVVVPNMDTLWGGTKTAQEVADTIKAEGDKLLAA